MLTKTRLAELLAVAMNLLNDIHNEVNEDGHPILAGKKLGDFHELASAMPASVDYWNNGTVCARDLLR
jgi:hypothetical protein